MSQDTDKDNVVSLESPNSVPAQASAWLAKLDGEQPSEADLQAFKRWVNEDESHIAAFEKVATAWDDLNILTRLPSVLQQREIQQRNRQRESAHRPALRSSVGYFAIAATLVLGLFIALYSDFFSAQQATYMTVVGEQKTIRLPDNSLVQLNTNSRIQFDYQSEARTVYLLQGEVHFSVAKNPQRPFEVYAGTGRVRAVGTAFTVELSNRNDDVNVLVTEGVVEVVPELGMPSPPAGDTEALPVAADESPLISQLVIKPQRVAAGSAVLFNQKEVKAVRKVDDVAMQRLLAWQQGLLIFSGESLEEVVAEISRYTDTKIIIQSEEARTLRIGGQFQLGNTQAILRALEQGFGLRAEYATSNLVYLSYKKSNL